VLSPRDRYLTDAVFHHLVDTLVAAVEAAQVTPSEIREAAMLAQILYEERHPRLRRPIDDDFGGQQWRSENEK
jgi:hypothetical protein